MLFQTETSQRHQYEAQKRNLVMHMHVADHYLPDMTQKGVTTLRLSIRLLDEQKSVFRSV